MPSNSLALALSAVFAFGLASFAAGTLLVRVAPRRRTVRWPLEIDATLIDCDAPLRLALVERLGTIATPWSARVLREAVREEFDPVVRAAIDGALAQHPDAPLLP